MNTDQLTSYFNSLSFEDKVDACKSAANELGKLHRQHGKICKTCAQYKGSFSGKGRGSNLQKRKLDLQLKKDDQLTILRTYLTLI